MLRVAFDAQGSYGGKSGLGVYVKSLVHALQSLNHSESVKIDYYPDEISSFRGFLNTPRRLRWETTEFPRSLKNKNYDLVHIPAFAMGWHKIKSVLTVHDLIGLAFPNQKRIAGRFYWGQWLAWAARRAHHLIADSEHTRRDLISFLKIPENKITLIYPSGHEGFRADIDSETINKTKNKFNIRDPYFIFVGTFEPRKNLPRVMKAFQSFLQSKPHYQLVLVGSSEFAHGQYWDTLVAEHGLDLSRILTPGFIDHESLNALYCGAEALIFPSLYEGFGIPILEAMASGCPVITANATSTPEVAGHAGLLVNPENELDIADAMKCIAGNQMLRSDLQSKGFIQIKKFSWTQTAQQTIDLYRKLAI